MGQAKQRGTFEQRRSQAIERKSREREIRKQAEMARESSMTQEDRMRIAKARRLLSAMICLASYR